MADVRCQQVICGGRSPSADLLTCTRHVFARIPSLSQSAACVCVRVHRISRKEVLAGPRDHVMALITLGAQRADLSVGVPVDIVLFVLSFTTVVAHRCR